MAQVSVDNNYATSPYVVTGRHVLEAGETAVASLVVRGELGSQGVLGGLSKRCHGDACAYVLDGEEGVLAARIGAPGLVTVVRWLGYSRSVGVGEAVLQLLREGSVVWEAGVLRWPGGRVFLPRVEADEVRLVLTGRPGAMLVAGSTLAELTSTSQEVLRFLRWETAGGETSSRRIVAEGSGVVTAVYGASDRPVYRRVRLRGKSWYLPGQWIVADIPEGTWLVRVEGSGVPGIVAVGLLPNGTVARVPANGSLLRFFDPGSGVVLKGRYCPGHMAGECVPNPPPYNTTLLPSVERDDIRMVFLGFAAPLDCGTCFQGNVTLATYNLTLLNATSPGDEYYLPIVVSSLGLRLAAVYGERGVHVVWELYWKYLPLLNISVERPWASVAGVLLDDEGRVVAWQELGNNSIKLPSAGSTASLYLGYDYLRRLAWPGEVWRAEVWWMRGGEPGGRVPYSQSGRVDVIPVTLRLEWVGGRPLLRLVRIGPGMVTSPYTPGEWVRQGVFYCGLLRAFVDGTEVVIHPFTGLAQIPVPRRSLRAFLIPNGTVWKILIPIPLHL